MVDDIDYIVKLVGDDYVGIGSDFDGVSSVPVGMDDVIKDPLIMQELKRRGYSNKSIKKIPGGNVMRVMKQILNKAQGSKTKAQDLCRTCALNLVPCTFNLS